MDLTDYIKWPELFKYVTETMDDDDKINERACPFLARKYMMNLMPDECFLNDNNDTVSFIFGGDDGSDGNESNNESSWWSVCITISIRESDYPVFMSFEEESG